MRTFSGHRLRQHEDELRAFTALLQDEGVTRYLEIGACHGDSFFAIMTALPAGSTGVAVDLPESSAWGKKGSADALEKAAADLCARGYSASVIFGDSASEGIRALVAHRGPYDAVFIDGDHTYEGVRADWLAYGPMAHIVAFHDIDGQGQKTKKGSLLVEVPRLWREIRGDHPHREIIGAERGMGIGVLWR